MNTILLEEKNICLIDFNDIFKSIETSFLNDIYDYDLMIDEQIPLTPDTKKIFYHHVIHNLCEHIIKAPKDYRKIIYAPLQINDQFEICNLCDCKKINKLFHALIKKLEKKLPVLIIFQQESLDFEFLKNKCFWGDGKGIDFLNFLEVKCEKYENGLYNRNFSKIKEFTKKYELKFLNKNYFDNLKTKQILYK